MHSQQRSFMKADFEKSLRKQNLRKGTGTLVINQYMLEVLMLMMIDGIDEKTITQTKHICFWLY